MAFHRGQKVEIFRKSDDESWGDHMDQYVGLHGIITDPDTTKNDPDALIEVRGVEASRLGISATHRAARHRRPV